MGIFGSIKKNLSHGGVKLDMQAPASVSMQDAALPVTITVTSTDSPSHINSVKAEIIAESHNQNFSQPTDSGINNSQISTQTVARAEHNQAFDVAVGQSQSVQLNIVMNAGAAVGQTLPEGNAAASLLHSLSQLQAVGEALNAHSYSYFLQVSADVEGVALDPSKRQPIQVLKPGQIGGGFNINL